MNGFALRGSDEHDVALLEAHDRDVGYVEELLNLPRHDGEEVLAGGLACDERRYPAE